MPLKTWSSQALNARLEMASKGRRVCVRYSQDITSDNKSKKYNACCKSKINPPHFSSGFFPIFSRKENFWTLQYILQNKLCAIYEMSILSWLRLQPLSALTSSHSLRRWSFAAPSACGPGGGISRDATRNVFHAKFLLHHWAVVQILKVFILESPNLLFVSFKNQAK